MTTLGILKNDIRAIVGASCMLRSDRRGRAFFFSDFPLRADESAAERLRNGGFDVKLFPEGALIDPGSGRVMDIYLSLPAVPRPCGAELLDAAAALLLRHETPPERQDPEILRGALRLALTGDRERLWRHMHRALADALRSKAPVPSLLARLTCYF